MIYRERMQSLLESLNNKLKTLQGISQGAINIPASDVNTLIKQSIDITHTLENLVSAER